MATTNLYLDTRRARADGKYPLKLKVTLSGSNGFLLNLQTPLSSDQWDKRRGRVVRHPYASELNQYLQGKQNEVEMILRTLALNGEIRRLKATAIKAKIVDALSGAHGNSKHSFVEHFSAFAEKRNKKSTCEIYLQTLKRIVAYAGEDLAFEDITYSWLIDFEQYMQRQGLSQNTQDIQFRNIRAAYKDMMQREVIPASSYPFDKFKHRQVTVEIDTLSVEQLIEFRDYPCEPHQQLYVDLFMLMFYLHGINIGDLLLLKPTDFRKGRIEFDRQKTGRHYSIKVEPEALEIINKYRGSQYLINVLDKWSEYRSFSSKMNTCLKQIGEVQVLKYGRKERIPFCPGLTTYWARRSFATIAYTDAGIPVDVIGQMLGHQTKNQVTWRYIKTSQKTIDDANRKVLDLFKKV